MTDLQCRLLPIMKWFHKLCDEQNFTYYALGGTALGAVRHNGFIPWDDDLDVGMPRKDYERLKVLSQKINTLSNYVIEFPDNKKDFVYPYCKIYDTNTTLVENTRYKTKRGIYIDVFPIDGVGNTWEESIKRFNKIDRKRNLLCARVCALRKNRSLHKNFAILLSRCIPDFLLNPLEIIKNINESCKERQYDKYTYVANFCGNWHEKEIMNKEWVKNPVLCKFEDMQIYIPKDTDAYLTRLYGNYMQLPPVEKRVTHHDFLHLDLNKSYLE